MWKNTDFHKKFEVSELFEVKEELVKPKPKRVQPQSVSKKTTIPRRPQMEKPDQEKTAAQKPEQPQNVETQKTEPTSTKANHPVPSSMLNREIEYVEIPELILDEDGKSTDKYN